MSKFKYNPGDLLGPMNILMIQRTKKKNSKWMANFKCPYCGKIFESTIQAVVQGDKKSCGCKSTTAKDITNQKFGRLTALYPTEKRTSSGIIFWHCKCNCGKEIDVRITSLLNGDTTSCGCYRTELKSHNLQGQTFGHLLVLKRLEEKDKAGYFLWECQCDCGKIIKVNTHSLVSGNTKSCGHYLSLQEEQIAKILDDLNIKYIRQKTFPDCFNDKTKALLKFDFFLPEYNCCIEYDGEQHFIAKDFFGGEQGLKETQFRDNIKNIYCKNKKIKLIRISYLNKNNINKQYILSNITSERYGGENEQ